MATKRSILSFWVPFCVILQLLFVDLHRELCVCVCVHACVRACATAAMMKGRQAPLLLRHPGLQVPAPWGRYGHESNEHMCE